MNQGQQFNGHGRQAEWLIVSWMKPKPTVAVCDTKRRRVKTGAYRVDVHVEMRKGVAKAVQLLDGCVRIDTNFGK